MKILKFLNLFNFKNVFANLLLNYRILHYHFPKTIIETQKIDIDMYLYYTVNPNQYKNKRMSDCLSMSITQKPPNRFQGNFAQKQPIYLGVTYAYLFRYIFHFKIAAYLVTPIHVKKVVICIVKINNDAQLIQFPWQWNPFQQNVSGTVRII